MKKKKKDEIPIILIREVLGSILKFGHRPEKHEG